jgi:hypothetical protein
LKTSKIFSYDLYCCGFMLFCLEKFIDRVSGQILTFGFLNLSDNHKKYVKLGKINVLVPNFGLRVKFIPQFLYQPI